jgi:hypothetical protein
VIYPGLRWREASTGSGFICAASGRKSLSSEEYHKGPARAAEPVIVIVLVVVLVSRVLIIAGSNCVGPAKGNMKEVANPV